MFEIFNKDKVLGTPFSAHATVGLRYASTREGELLSKVRQDMVMKLASQISQTTGVIKSKTEVIGGVPFLEYRADFILVTLDELAEMRKDSFKSGVMLTQGYMSLQTFPNHK